MEEVTMAEKCAKATTEQSLDKKQFICGVIEGFYGRPWTTEQRKSLFRKLQKWGMGAYVYAPKDDYKHRAFWRDLYTVEEADHLTSLIAAAKERGIMFYYALSPGLDMSYSSPKEILSLKRKLDQVSQFGCEGFALLFDDIESELSKADKEVFQTFSNAQVSVTNEIYTHLGNPRFLFCPTQYCTSRATPTVHDSEYLNTLGSKLNNEIDIMWTGSKVISKTITLESIREITEVLRRPPVIWDNLHANDYDQKRVFLGPYSGRSPELIPHLRGVMTNPNCEFHANTIAIHTLASWSKCSLDAKLNSSLSADIKLETENDDGTAAEEVDLPAECVGSKSVYHPRVALKNAVKEWLSEFVFEKEAWGPIMKPQPQVTMVMPIIPIIPSINTCMSLTTTTTTSTNAKTTAVPEVSTTQLQALADVCSTVNSSAMNPISNPIMNSLVSPTKVVTNDDILNPISSNAALNIELPKKIPISIVSVPIMHTKEKHFNDSLEDEQADDTRPMEDALATTNIVQKDVEIEEDVSNKLVSPTMKTCVAKVCGTSLLQDDEDVSIEDRSQKPDQTTALSTETVNMLDEHNLSPLSTGNEPMECSSSLASQTSPKGDRKLISEDVVMADTASNTMQVESSEASPLSNADMKDDDDEDREKEKTSNDEDKIGVDDLYLLCDLFYLPFEHGSRGYKLLNEFNWLKANASVLLGGESKQSALLPPKPEVAEWLQRAATFAALCGAVQELLRKISLCANKEICHDLFSYLWDIASALSLLNAFIKWLSLGYFPPNVYTFTQGSYTWFSKGWKEAFMSGDQEPWVFRGGLTADFQRLMPVDSGNDLFFYIMPELPTSDFHLLRPFTPLDETEVNQVCTRGFLSIIFGEQDSASVTLPDNLSDLISDSIIGPFVTLNPELCCLATDAANSIVGYAAAALDVKLFVRNLEMCWLPAMREKYTQSALPKNGSNPPLTASDKLNDLLVAMMDDFDAEDYQCPPDVSATYPAVLTLAVLDDTLERDHGIARRLLTVTLAALRANGCFGAHVRVPLRDINLVHYFSSLGFAELPRDMLAKYVYLGRRF